MDKKNIILILLIIICFSIASFFTGFAIGLEQEFNITLDYSQNIIDSLNMLNNTETAVLKLELNNFKDAYNISQNNLKECYEIQHFLINDIKNIIGVK